MDELRVIAGQEVEGVHCLALTQRHGGSLNQSAALCVCVCVWGGGGAQQIARGGCDKPAGVTAVPSRPAPIWTAEPPAPSTHCRALKGEQNIKLTLSSQTSLIGAEKNHCVLMISAEYKIRLQIWSVNIIITEIQFTTGPNF